MLFPLFWSLLRHTSNLFSLTSKNGRMFWLPRLVQFCGYRSCYFLFIYRSFDDSSFSYYVSCRFQLFYVKILTSISSSIIFSGPSSSLSLELLATPSFDCVSCAQRSLVFLIGQMVTSSSELSTRSSNLLPYLLDSDTIFSCNSLLSLNVYFKICFLSIQMILLTWSFQIFIQVFLTQIKSPITYRSACFSKGNRTTTRLEA